MKITARVKPNAKTTSVTPGTDGTLSVRVAAPPTDGKANTALIAAVAAYYAVPKSRVKLIKGAGGKIKTLEIN